MVGGNPRLQKMDILSLVSIWPERACAMPATCLCSVCVDTRMNGNAWHRHRRQWVCDAGKVGSPSTFPSSPTLTTSAICMETLHSPTQELPTCACRIKDGGK